MTTSQDVDAKARDDKDRFIALYQHQFEKEDNLKRKQEQRKDEECTFSPAILKQKDHTPEKR